MNIGRSSRTEVRRYNAAGSKTNTVYRGKFVPTILSEMVTDSDPKKAERVMQAMLQMKKSTSKL